MDNLAVQNFVRFAFLCNFSMLCADVVLFKLVRKLHNFDLIVLNLLEFLFSWYSGVVFSLCCSCVNHCLD
jgi:hypothetical protein